MLSLSAAGFNVDALGVSAAYIVLIIPHNNDDEHYILHYELFRVFFSKEQWTC